MTDHLEQAAARASELAGELDRIDETAVTNAQRHLIYLAGLIRGGAVREPRQFATTNTYATTKADVILGSEEPSVFVPVSEEESSTLGTVRAAVGADETLPYSELVRRIRAAHAQRDELLAAAKALLERDNGTTRSCLNSVVARIEAE